MANNQVFLKCPCGARLRLGKYYPTEWEFGSWSKDFAAEINEFLSAHAHAHEEDMSFGLLDGGFPFALETESEAKIEPISAADPADREGQGQGQTISDGESEIIAHHTELIRRGYTDELLTTGKHKGRWKWSPPPRKSDEPAHGTK